MTAASLTIGAPAIEKAGAQAKTIVETGELPPKPYGTSPENGQTVFEPNHPRTDINDMAIGMMDQALWRTPHCYGLFERLKSQPAMQAVTPKAAYERMNL